MPVRYGLMRSAAKLMEMMPCLSVFGEAIPQGPDACHGGKGQQENKNWPHVIRGQSLGQDAKHDNHLMNILYERRYCSSF